ncbi:unnamed protein product [Caenorhabditis brenneri]
MCGGCDSCNPQINAMSLRERPRKSIAETLQLEHDRSKTRPIFRRCESSDLSSITVHSYFFGSHSNPPKMPCLATGDFTILYTLCVYLDVLLLQENQDWKWIIAIFCLTWTGVYLLKRLMNCYPHPNQYSRHLSMVTTGLFIFNIVAEQTRSLNREIKKQFCSNDAITDMNEFWAATVFCATYILLIRKSAKKCGWFYIKDIWMLKAGRYLMATCFLLNPMNNMFGGCVKMTDNIYIFHEVILTIMVAWNIVYIIAIVAEILGIIVVDEGISLPTRINNAAEGVFNEKKTVQD